MSSMIPVRPGRILIATAVLWLSACAQSSAPVAREAPASGAAGPPAEFEPARRYLASAAGNGPAQGGVTSADFNNDGLADIAVTDTMGNAVRVLLNAGDGSLLPAASFLVGALPYALLAADLDGDGHVDIAVANSRSDDVSVLRGLGNGQFAAAQSYASGLGPTDIAAFDVNGDGLRDLLTYYGEISVLLNDGRGGFMPAPDIVVGEPTGAVAIAMEAADFTADGLIDLAVTYWPNGPSRSTIVQLINQGEGQFQAVDPVISISGGTEAMRAADVNCDGVKDLVVPIAGGGFLILPGRAGQPFGEPVEIETDSGSNAVEFNDFNGDGLLDMAVSYFNGYVGLVEDVCRSDWSLAVTYDTVETSEAMVSPDLNLDGRPDLVVATWFHPEIAVLLNRTPPRTGASE
jgi:hypothetical protein